MYGLHHQGGYNWHTQSISLQRTSVVVTANVPSSPIVFTLMMEAICFSETTATRRHIPEDGILHSYRRENLKPYIE
jgi:hypothetical protein